MNMNLTSTEQKCSANPAVLFISLILSIFNNLKEERSIVNIQGKYDFIIVGGGSAGCVVANRLSEISSWQILLLEAGAEQPNITNVPALSVMIPHSRQLDWNYLTVPQPEACNGQPCTYPRGKMLGGSSAHNAMLYIRGNSKCFDDWCRAGNYGWCYDDVLPYFKKSEDNRDPDIARNKRFHSTGGYLSVQRYRYIDENAKTTVRAVKEMGFRSVDENAESQCGYSFPQYTVRNGERVSTNSAFVKPIRYSRKNLKIITGATVVKLLIDPTTKRTYGVQFIHSSLGTRNVYCKKEVILCAGTINSPQLLQLSGIGRATLLNKFKIPVIANLKGVGRNLQDHIYSTISPTLSLNRTSTFPSNFQEIVSDIKAYNKFRTGRLSGTSIVIVNTKSSGNDDNIPDIQIGFANSFIKANDSCSSEQIQLLFPYYNSLVILPFVVGTKSRGYVKITSTDPFAQPLISLNMCSNNVDCEVLVEGLERATKLGQARSFQNMDMVLDRTPLPRCSHFEFGSKTYWRCVIQGSLYHVFHAVGTCKMGPVSDPNAVVDPRLNVYGVYGLRVIDASIMPTIVNANTNAATIMIAEKGSDLIKEDCKKNITLNK